MSQEFLKTLKARRDRARKRVDSARKELTLSEADLRLWEMAIKAEEKGQVQEVVDALDGGPSVEIIPGGAKITLSLTDARTKSDILKNALRTSGGSIKMSQLVKLVAPAVSRASVYALAKQMKESGEIGEMPGGHIYLREGGLQKD